MKKVDKELLKNKEMKRNAEGKLVDLFGNIVNEDE